MDNYWDKPMASEPLHSYRYKGDYGWIMIGADSTEGALKEAARSIRYDQSITEDNLQRWDGTAYVNI